MSSFYVTKSDKFIWLNNNIELFDDEDEDKVDYLTPDFLTFVAWMCWLCPACDLYHMVGGGLARRDITVKQSESNWVTWDVHHTPHHHTTHRWLSSGSSASQSGPEKPLGLTGLHSQYLVHSTPHWAGPYTGTMTQYPSQHNTMNIDNGYRNIL